MKKNYSTNIQPFFDELTRTISYVVHFSHQKACVVIDPVLDLDIKSGKISTHHADQIVAYVKANDLQVEWLLETHAHADHLSAGHYLKEKLGGKLAIGQHITQVQSYFKGAFNLGEEFVADGSQFDYLFADDEVFYVGDVPIKALYVPGHTYADVAYYVDHQLFVGDTLFLEDLGTARCDFPGGSASALYDSIQKIFVLDDNTVLWMCHDYPENLSQEHVRDVRWQTTVGQQKKDNIHVGQQHTKEQFIQMRQARDASLSVPALLYPSVQVNICAGELPKPEANGVSYLKLPLTQMK